MIESHAQVSAATAAAAPRRESSGRALDVSAFAMALAGPAVLDADAVARAADGLAGGAARRLPGMKLASSADIDTLGAQLLDASAADGAPSLVWAIVQYAEREYVALGAGGHPAGRADIADLVSEFAARYAAAHAIAAPATALPKVAPARPASAAGSAAAALRTPAEQVTHWCAFLVDAPSTNLFPVEPLAADRPAAVSAFVRTLARSTHDAVGTFARASSVEAPIVLLSAFAALLRRYANDDDVTLATHVARRSPAPQTHAGRHANAVALRVNIPTHIDFRTLVERVRSAIDAACRNGDVSIDLLIEPRDAAACAAPGIAFDLLRAPAALAGWDEVRIWRARSAPPTPPAYDLALKPLESAEETQLRWEFAPGAYDRASVDRFAAQFEGLLAALVTDPAGPVGRPSLAAPAERAARLAAGLGPTPAYERDGSIAAVWREQVRNTPNAVALADARGALTYAQTDRRANALARHLAAAGVGPGTPVGIAFDRAIDLPIALLAILKAGGCYVPLDLTYPRERLATMIADAAIAIIISPGAIDADLAFAGRVIRLDTDGGAIDAHSAEPFLVPVAADAPAYITYTTGSTGRPKGVVVTQRGVLRLVRNVDYVRIEPHDGFLAHAPLAFDASTFEIWAPLLNGARLGIPQPGLLALADLAAAVERFDVTIAFLTTALFGRLVDSGLAAFGRLRTLLTGGEVASPAQMRRFIERYPTCRLVAVYGPTENTTFSTWCDLPDAAAIGTNVPIGRPIANSRAYVVDAFGELVPVGVPGELWVGGDGVATGYLNRAELNAERFGDDPFRAAASGRIYKTGDRARWRADDALEFLGRTDDQVKIRGFRIELGEIEAVLQTHPAVRDTAVVAALHAGEKALFAFVALQPGATADEAALRAHLSSKLPRYMLPHHLTIVARLPETASGKVDRVALARSAAAPPQAVMPGEHRPTSVANAGPAQRQLQTAIAEIWRAALGLERRPGLDDNFFDAGGDSLRLLGVHSALAQQLGIDIPIMTLFDRTTIRQLAAFVAERERAHVS